MLMVQIIMNEVVRFLVNNNNRRHRVFFSVIIRRIENATKK